MARACRNAHRRGRGESSRESKARPGTSAQSTTVGLDLETAQLGLGDSQDAGLQIGCERPDLEQSQAVLGSLDTGTENSLSRSQGIGEKAPRVKLLGKGLHVEQNGLG